MSETTHLNHIEPEYRKIDKNKHLKYSLDKELKVHLSYTEEQNLTQINFSEIIEKYLSKSYRYIVANISLTEPYIKG